MLVFLPKKLEIKSAFGVRLLRARVRQDGYTALIWASREGHDDCVEKLIAHGARVDIQDKVSEGGDGVCACLAAERNLVLVW